MLDRRVAPTFNRNFAFQLIDPEFIQLSNGTKIFFVNGGDQNVIKVELIFPAGRWSENVWGTSYFTTNLISKGTPSKNSFQIASQFDQLGAHLDVVAGMDFVTLSVYSLTRNLSQALDLLTEIIIESIFPEKEIQQLKSIYLQNLRVNEEKTSFLASKLFRKTLFGEQHPYGKELEENDLEKLLRDNLILFHQDFFHHFTVIVSGKIESSNRGKILESFSLITGKKIQEKTHQALASSTHQHHVDKANSIQTSLRIGKKIIDRTHPDYPQLILLNHILGGYFGSRLMKNIREEKGLTYGIYSSIHALKHESYLTIGTDVNKENKALAFTEIKKEIQRLCEEKISNDELDTARYHFIGSFQAELSTSFAHAEKIKSMALFNLEKDYYNTLLQRISNTDAIELQTIANRYFAADSFYEVSAG